MSQVLNKRLFAQFYAIFGYCTRSVQNIILTFDKRKKTVLSLINKAKVVTVAGTRPEIIKLADIIPLLREHFEHAFVYTGQHFSQNMKDIFFDGLGIEPDYDFKSNTSNIDTLRDNMLPTLQRISPKYVIVYGDTNSSMAAALAASQIKAQIIHLEAGVRDFDYAVPEEPLRIKIDEMSKYLFAPSQFCATVLTYENVSGSVFLTGNLIVDVCRRFSKLAESVTHQLNRNDIPEEYLLLTLHRPENVDNPVNLKLLCKHLQSVSYKIVFPIHPRTQQTLAKFNIILPPNIVTIDPVGYIDFLYLLRNCRLVLTDSGGLQEECVVLKKPCITLRHTSARWETILLKANILFPPDNQDSLQDIVEVMLATKINRNPYGENVAQKTIDILKQVIM
jgi:UDP-N-acetylglucosamine 2-epimerase